MSNPPISPPPISLPAGYAPAVAFGYADAEARLAMVSAEKPLPVALASSTPAEQPTPLAGTASDSGIAGPFLAAKGLPVTVALEGEWAGTIRLLRSTDGGTTRLPLRIGGMEWGAFHERGVEQVWMETEGDASYYLDIALETGTLAYRVSQ